MADLLTRTTAVSQYRVSVDYVNLLEADVLYPGLVGYFGWNYEAAVALEALLEESKLATMLEPLGLNQSELDLTTSAEQETSVLDILEQSLEFPQAGAFIKRGWPTFWLVGDVFRCSLCSMI